VQYYDAMLADRREAVLSSRYCIFRLDDLAWRLAHRPVRYIALDGRARLTGSMVVHFILSLHHAGSLSQNPPILLPPLQILPSIRRIPRLRVCKTFRPLLDPHRDEWCQL